MFDQRLPNIATALLRTAVRRWRPLRLRRKTLAGPSRYIQCINETDDAVTSESHSAAVQPFQPVQPFSRGRTAATDGTCMRPSAMWSNHYPSSEKDASPLPGGLRTVAVQLCEKRKQQCRPAFQSRL